ncbi:ABC transporter permease [Campylobacter sp. RM16187]|uniref:ABC transporter permease n=1 Tax=Campylobacter sp. RM16187 TaxID=1660063 RepID=UPI0021B56944|nr:ABC transporter permease [Campylobacter sp. RM16187]
MFKIIYSYRFFILNSVLTELKIKFARSKLGIFWAILHPLAQVLIYAIVLSSVLSAKLPGINNKYAYSIYLISGMLCWSLFSEILLRSVGVFTDNANLIKKMNFPKIVLLFNIIFSAIINNIFFFSVSVLIFIFLGHSLGISLFILPIFFILTIIMSASFGLIFGILNVFIRDISQLINIALQFIFWLTPIVYMINIVPEKFSFFLKLNPLLNIIEGYHQIIIYNQIPNFLSFIYPIIISIISITICFLCTKEPMKKWRTFYDRNTEIKKCFQILL